jgi:hypothetical protein
MITKTSKTSSTRRKLGSSTGFLSQFVPSETTLAVDRSTNSRSPTRLIRTCKHLHVRLTLTARFALFLIQHPSIVDKTIHNILKLCSEHGPICHLFELILVIHANTSNEINHIVYHVFVGIPRSHGCYYMLTYHAQVNIPCRS